MCSSSINNSSDLHIDVINTIDDQIDKFEQIGIL